MEIFVDNMVEKRKQKLEEKKNLLVEIQPKFLKAFQESNLLEVSFLSLQSYYLDWKWSRS